MRKLIMKMAVSLNGFVADSDGRKDWMFKTSDDQMLDWSVNEFRQAGLIIMGRKSFEDMAPYWPTATGLFAEPMNNIPKAVFTKKGFDASTVLGKLAGKPTPAEASWIGAQIYDGDLAQAISKLKGETGKPIVALGGAGFMRSLISIGLIDEYHLGVHPVALGSGLQIFPDLKMPLYLKLIEVKTFPAGGMAVHYSA